MANKICNAANRTIVIQVRAASEGNTAEVHSVNYDRNWDSRSRQLHDKQVISVQEACDDNTFLAKQAPLNNNAIQEEDVHDDSSGETENGSDSESSNDNEVDTNEIDSAMFDQQISSEGRENENACRGYYVSFERKDDNINAFPDGALSRIYTSEENVEVSNADQMPTEHNIPRDDNTFLAEQAPSNNNAIQEEDIHDDSSGETENGSDSESSNDNEADTNEIDSAMFDQQISSGGRENENASPGCYVSFERKDDNMNALQEGALSLTYTSEENIEVSNADQMPTEHNIPLGDHHEKREDNETIIETVYDIRRNKDDADIAADEEYSPQFDLNSSYVDVAVADRNTVGHHDDNDHENDGDDAGGRGGNDGGGDYGGHNAAACGGVGNNVDSGGSDVPVDGDGGVGNAVRDDDEDSDGGDDDNDVGGRSEGNGRGDHVYDGGGNGAGDDGDDDDGSGLEEESARDDNNDNNGCNDVKSGVIKHSGETVKLSEKDAVAVKKDNATKGKFVY